MFDSHLWKKTTVIITAAVCILFLFCNVTVFGKDPVTFTIFYHFTPQEARGIVFRELIEQFNNEHRGEIEVKLSFFADWMPLQQKIRTMVATGNPPDMFYFTFNPNDLSLFESGKLLDFNEYMDPQWRQRFFPSDLEMLTYNDKLLAIPSEQGSVLFYYNDKLFEKAGIPDFPKTWDEFFNACEALKKAGITPVSLFTADDAWHATNFFTYFAAGVGGSDVFAPGVRLDSDAIIKAAEYLKKLFEYTTPDAVGGKWAVSVQNFIVGKTAMLLDGPWVIGMIDEQMADAESVRVTRAPVFNNDEPYIVVTDALVAWAASNTLNDDQKEAAVEFLKWLTSEEISKKFFIEGKFPFAVKMQLTEEEKLRAGEKLSANVELTTNAGAKVVQFSRVVKPSVLNVLPQLIEKLVTDQITPEGFAKELQKANE